MRPKASAIAKAFRTVKRRKRSSARCLRIAVLYAPSSNPISLGGGNANVAPESAIARNFSCSSCSGSFSSFSFCVRSSSPFPPNQVSSSARHSPAWRMRSLFPNAYEPVSPYWYVMCTLNGAPSSG